MFAVLLQNFWDFLGALLPRTTAAKDMEIDLEPGLHLGLRLWAPFTVHVKDD